MSAEDSNAPRRSRLLRDWSCYPSRLFFFFSCLLTPHTLHVWQNTCLFDRLFESAAWWLVWKYVFSMWFNQHFKGLFILKSFLNLTSFLWPFPPDLKIVWCVSLCELCVAMYFLSVFSELYFHVSFDFIILLYSTLAAFFWKKRESSVSNTHRANNNIKNRSCWSRSDAEPANETLSQAAAAEHFPAPLSQRLPRISADGLIKWNTLVEWSCCGQTLAAAPDRLCNDLRKSS